jgi:recombination protein RecR
VQTLIDELGRLPGIGPKSAQRIAYYLLKSPAEDANRLASSITEAKARVTWCQRCFSIAEGELCAYCQDDRRDSTSLCVVEEPRDIVAIERTHEFNGRYHVLQGAISPIEGIGPEQLRMDGIAFFQQEFSEVRTVLTSDAGDEGYFGVGHRVMINAVAKGW